MFTSKPPVTRAAGCGEVPTAATECQPHVRVRGIYAGQNPEIAVRPADQLASQLLGGPRNWGLWRVLGLNQRRLSRRFYRPLPLTTRATRRVTGSLRQRDGSLPDAARSTTRRAQPQPAGGSRAWPTRPSTSSARSTARRSTTRCNQAAKELSQRFDFRGVERVGRVVGRARHHDQGRHRGARQGRARRVQGEAGQALDLDEGARRRRAEAVRQELRHLRDDAAGHRPGPRPQDRQADQGRGPEGRAGRDPGRPAARLGQEEGRSCRTSVALLKGADLDVPLQFTNYR